MRLDCAYHIDLLMEDKFTIELKSVERIKETLPQEHSRGSHGIIVATAAVRYSFLANFHHSTGDFVSGDSVSVLIRQYIDLGQGDDGFGL